MRAGHLAGVKTSDDPYTVLALEGSLLPPVLYVGHVAQMLTGG